MPQRSDNLLAHELRLTLALLARERNDMEGLMDSITEGILQLGPGGKIVRANYAARALLDLPPTPEGYSLEELVQDDTLLSILQDSSPGETALPREVMIDGRPLLIRARTLPEHLGVGTVIVLLDLTELQRFEGLRRDFVANASHELKTPLTSIRGYVELLLDRDPPPELRYEFLEKIARNARRLEALIEDLLDLSRLDTGGWRPQPETIDLNEIALEAWTPFEERADRKRVRFTLSIQVETLIADRTGLVRILTNIFDNALRYTPEGGSIQVVARTTSPKHGTRSTEIEITDTGSGIPAESLPRIFERFYRVDTARARNDGGTGLGLSIVKHLAERMGGEVSATSELKRGTTITLLLPTPPV